MQRLLRAGAELLNRNSDPPTNSHSDSPISMVSSPNVIITGGTFNQIVGGTQGPRRRPTADNYTGEESGLEVLNRHVAAGAMHDSAERSNAARCHPDTRIAVLGDILSWIQDKDRKTHILWLHGPAGAGKTSICQTIAEICQDIDDLAASFFFDQGDNARALIPTIAYQIAQSANVMKKHISTAVLKDPLQIFSKSLPTQMRELIVQPLNQTVANGRVDECRPEDSQENILQALHFAVKSGSFPLCILISSRNEPHILDAFEGHLRDFTHVIALDEKYEPDKDIATYLRSSFTTIQRKHRHNRSLTSTSSWPSEPTLQTLVSRASGQFIYAATIIRFVDVRHQSPSQRLEMALGFSELQGGLDGSSPFAELDKLYQEIFREVFDIRLTLRVLGSILLLRSPICLEDLENLLGLQAGETEIALVRLHSILNVSDSPDSCLKGRFVHFYHESLKDFLFDAHRSGTYHIKCDVIHHDLSQRFFRHLYLSKKPRFINVPSERAILKDWLHHMSMIEQFDDDSFTYAMDIKIDRILDCLNMAFTITNRFVWPEVLDLIEQISILTNRFRQRPTTQNSVLIEKFTHILNLYFRHALLPRFENLPEIRPKTLAVLSMFKLAPDSSPAALGCLLQLNWSEFVLATLPLRPFMAFSPSISFTSQAFSAYISNSSCSRELIPMTPDIQADLTIYCLECIKRYHSPSQALMTRTIEASLSYPRGNGVEEAYQYAKAHWREHLRYASARRLLNYTYFVNARDGYLPICTHENQCNLRCEVVGLFRCIEEQIIVSEAVSQSPSRAAVEQEYVYLLKEVIDTKYLGTPLFSRVKIQMEQWSREFKQSYLNNEINGSNAQLRNDRSTFNYDVQGVLWASRKGYKGKWPL
ncbi:hypothetical protein BJ912DRAFT_984030 [Pholiota molesta]|nr:hypothetical protein BJ912DRAFT_984030 [Pholiota molesta]